MIFELGGIRRLQQRLGHGDPAGAELQRQRVQLGFGVLQLLSELSIPVVAEIRFVLRRLARILLCLEDAVSMFQQRRPERPRPAASRDSLRLAERQPFFGQAVDLVAILVGKFELAPCVRLFLRVLLSRFEEGISDRQAHRADASALVTRFHKRDLAGRAAVGVRNVLSSFGHGDVSRLPISASSRARRIAGAAFAPAPRIPRGIACSRPRESLPLSARRSLPRD